MAFKLTRTTAGGYSATYPPGPDRDMYRLAVNQYGYLVPRGTRVTGPELAARIRATYDNPQAAEVAALLERNA